MGMVKKEFIEYETGLESQWRLELKWMTQLTESKPSRTSLVNGLRFDVLNNLTSLKSMKLLFHT